MFTQSCFIRNANKDLIYNIMALGYKAMYMTWRNNIEGNNLVLEYNTWHFTDSDNHPNSIDCGTNEDLFLAMAALRDDTDKNQWFVYDNTDYADEQEQEIAFFICKQDSIKDEMCINSMYADCHKATVKELIEYFKNK